MGKPSRRTVLLITSVVVVALVVANVAGVLRYPGGPLRASNANGPFWLDWRPADQGYNKVGVSAAAALSTGVPMYVGIFPRNQWSLVATIEGVRLVNATPGLRLVEARLIRQGSAPNGAVGLAYGTGEQVEGLGLYTDYDPLPRSLAGATAIADGVMWVEVIADHGGEQAFDSIVVDYRVGPFTFTVDMYQAFSACVVPMPAGATCSWDVP